MAFIKKHIHLLVISIFVYFLCLLIITVESHETYRQRHRCVDIGGIEISDKPLRISGLNVEYTKSETHLYRCDNGVRRM